MEALPLLVQWTHSRLHILSSPQLLHSSLFLLLMASPSSAPFAFIFLVFSTLHVSQGELLVGFYSNSCPNAEAVVRSAVMEAASSDPKILAGLLRIHYHDCIVQGCEGSVLIQRPVNEKHEKDSPGHAGLNGFAVIERAKALLEAQCAGVVSCADIVALAARDSVVLSQGPFYNVPTGRRDGRVSNPSDTDNMPDPEESLESLKQKFAEKGLNEKDLVLLSSAHTIGTTACFFIQNRIYNFSDSTPSDPLINPQFLPELKSKCPFGRINDRLALDHGSEATFDHQILHNIQTGFGVIGSDAKLYTDSSTKALIDAYASGQANFEFDFAESMVKMGTIGVKTGSDGEIRRVCSAFN